MCPLVRVGSFIVCFFVHRTDLGGRVDSWSGAKGVLPLACIQGNSGAGSQRFAPHPFNFHHPRLNTSAKAFTTLPRASREALIFLASSAAMPVVIPVCANLSYPARSTSTNLPYRVACAKQRTWSGLFEAVGLRSTHKTLNITLLHTGIEDHDRRSGFFVRLLLPCSPFSLLLGTHRLVQRLQTS